MSHTFPICSNLGPYAYDPNIQALWTDEIADVNAPTESEVSGALVLNDYQLTDIIGWEVRTNIITAPPWGAFSTELVGQQAVEQAEMVFASERQGDDIRMVLQRRDLGYVLLLPSGPYAEQPSAPFNVYPVRVAQVTQMQRLRTGGSQIFVQFAIHDVVGENVRTVVES